MARRTGRPSFLLSFSELPDSHYNRVEEKLRLDAFAWIVYLKMFRRMAVSTLCKQPGNIETGEELPMWSGQYLAADCRFWKKLDFTPEIMFRLLQPTRRSYLVLGILVLRARYILPKTKNQIDY